MSVVDSQFAEPDDTDVTVVGESGQGLTAAGEGHVFTRSTPRRPNKLRLTTVRIHKRDGRRFYVTGVDTLGGTPVLDRKPHADWAGHLDTSEKNSIVFRVYALHFI
jgi:tRNA (Thr-GGU) A37 N-methylase